MAWQVDLPEEVLRRLQVFQERLIVVADIWWLPADRVRYPGGKDRFCLVAGIESGPDGTPLRVRVVVGSTKASTGITTVRVAAGDSGLNEETYFRFWWSGEVAATVLRTEGKWRGRLNQERVTEIEAAIKASHLVALKRLWP